MSHVLGRPQNPQNLRSSSKASRLLGHGTSLGPTSCFYWASKLPCGTFWAGPKTFKTSAAAQQLSKASHLLGHGTSLGPTSCFYWASKLPCGTFWAGPKTLKTSAAAFEGLRTSQPSAAAQQLSKASRLLGHGTSLGPTSCFYWASKLPCGTFWAGPKTLKNLRSSFRRPSNLTTSQQLSSFRRRPACFHGTSLGPTSCFYWASKLPCGTFGAGPKTLTTSAAPFEGLRTSQPSAAAQQLSKASRLLGHGTCLGPTSCFYWASKLPCGTFWAGAKTLKTSAAAQQLSKASRLLGHGTSLGPTSCFYWASKLPCGTFWAGPKTLKTSAAAFEGLRTSQPSAAAQQLSKASRLLGHGTSLGPTSCFYWASKLPCGTFWAGPKTLKTSAAAFEGLRTSQLRSSSAAFEGVPLASMVPP